MILTQAFVHLIVSLDVPIYSLFQVSLQKSTIARKNRKMHPLDFAFRYKNQR